MKKIITIFMAATLILAISGVVYADWNPEQPAKWVQMPDLTPTGIDVFATTPKILADDFECTETGLIKDIHIWGSWLDDVLPVNDAGAYDPSRVGFRLSIYADIPEDPTTESHSMPGEELWSLDVQPGQFQVNLYADDLQEGWYNPNTGEYTFPGDTKCYQYNFFIDPANAFRQAGSLNNPVIYWLGVQASPVATPTAPAGVFVDPEGPKFGWKTSLDHWQDDAVWADAPIGAPVGPWNELRYPDGHQLYPDSMDLAFAITPEPTTIALLGLGSLVFLRKRRI